MSNIIHVNVILKELNQLKTRKNQNNIWLVDDNEELLKERQLKM